ncbi:MAG: ATP-binding cassette domain-containing protein [Terrimicrobiaceae bacterium]|nr:ATP-binding cassette domain-containing protein [Terrimicrobiaceae bacterium]
MNAITCENLSCSRENWNGQGPARVDSVSLSVAAGEFVGVCGPDGCGKGLLLNMLGLLERPDSGRLEVAGHDASELDEEDTTTLRNDLCGFLFAHPYLLPSFSIAENVAMPLFRIRGGDARDARDRTMRVLEVFGISGFEMVPAGRVPLEVRWRAALARALVHEPRLLIAISPPCPAEVLAFARRTADRWGMTILWAGHAAELEPFADRIIPMQNGRA